MTTTTGPLVVSEAMCQELVGRMEAFEAVEAVFSAMAKGDAYNFPVVREAIGAPLRLQDRTGCG